MDTTSTTEKIKYNDRWVRLTAAVLATHTIIVYGEPESSFELLLTKDYYTAFAGSFLIAFLLIEWVHQVTAFLDRRYEWVHKSIQRVLAQLLFGLVVPGLGAFFLAFTYFRFRGINILRTSYVNYDFPFIMLMLGLFNAYYLAYYFYLKWSLAEKRASAIATLIPADESEDGLEQVMTEMAGTFMVSKGSASIPIPTATIAYFYREAEVNYLRTFEGEDIFVSQSLDEISEQLVDRLFFRANRQVIIHVDAVDRFKGIEYGKLEVTLRPTYNEPVIVSQKRARSFRQWNDFNRYANMKTGTFN